MSQCRSEAKEASQDIIVEMDAEWEVEVLGNMDPEWENEVLGNILKSRQRKRPAKPSIFRVPPIMRSSNPDGYEPKLVSIGPYHHGKPSLQAMEEIKWQILDHLLSKDPKGSIHQYLKQMQGLAVEARSYYSEVINMESRKFAEMLLLDGFIIQLFIPRESMVQELKIR
ncbi:putative UPF0481 protein [Cocos nucifera]|nr:putative UPF0481 protein [Cocos nucifera]